MLEKLSLGDESSLVEKVKAEGVVKSGLADSIDALVAKCASKNEEDALAGLAAAKALAEGAPGAEAFTKQCLSACIQQQVSKSKAVSAAAKDTYVNMPKHYSFCNEEFASSNFCPASRRKEMAVPCSCPRMFGNIQQNSTQTAWKCPS